MQGTNLGGFRWTTRCSSGVRVCYSFHRFWRSQLTLKRRIFLDWAIGHLSVKQSLRIATTFYNSVTNSALAKDKTQTRNCLYQVN